MTKILNMNRIYQDIVNAYMAGVSNHSCTIKKRQFERDLETELIRLVQEILIIVTSR